MAHDPGRRKTPSPETRSIDPERFNKFASGLQSIITAFGLVIGGGWVLFTFWDLGTAQRARSDLAKVELDQREIQEKLAEKQPGLAIDLKWEPAGDTANGKHLFSLHAKLHNDGKKPVEFEDTELLVSRLSPESGVPELHFEPVVRSAIVLEADGSVLIRPARTLRVDQTRTLAFLIPPLASGNYLVQLKTTYHGLALVDTKLVPAGGEEIDAIEQRILTVPIAEPPPKPER